MNVNEITDPRWIEVAKSALQEFAKSVAYMEFEDVSKPASVLMAGWLRAAASQCRLLLLAHETGSGAAAAPNRRLVLEVIIRSTWLLEAGADAFEVLEDAEQYDLKTLERMMGADWITTNTPGLRERFTSDQHSNSKSNEFRIHHLTAAREYQGVYLGWWRETEGSHATRGLAVRFAEFIEGRIMLWSPPDDASGLVGIATGLAVVANAAAAIFQRDGHMQAVRPALKLMRRIDAMFESDEGAPAS